MAFYAQKVRTLIRVEQRKLPTVGVQGWMLRHALVMRGPLERAQAAHRSRGVVGPLWCHAIIKGQRISASFPLLPRWVVALSRVRSRSPLPAGVVAPVCKRRTWSLPTIEFRPKDVYALLSTSDFI